MKRIFAAASIVALAAGSVAAQPADPVANRGPGTGTTPGGAGAAPPGQTPPEEIGGVGVPVEIIIPAAIVTAGVVVAATSGGSSSSTNNTSTTSTD